MDGENKENPIKMDDLGENPLFLETPICDLFVDPIVVHLPFDSSGNIN